jgi:TctA family transporter
MFEVFKKLSRRDRIALIAGAAAIALFALFDFGILPLLERLGTSPEVIQQREVEIRRDQRLLVDAKLEAARFTTAEGSVKGLEVGLLDNSLPSLASAEWQRVVGQVADSKGLPLSSREFLHIQELGAGYSLVTGRVQFRCRLDQLVDFLVALASSPKALAVTGLSAYVARGDPQGGLNVQLTIGAVARTVKPVKAETAKH